MQWSDFAPYVMPHVIGCPSPIMEHHAKLMTMNWCRKTLCWQKWLDDCRTVPGQPVIELDVEQGLHIVKVFQVHVGGRQIDMVHPQAGRAVAAEGQDDGAEAVFYDTNGTLYKLPTPTERLPVRVFAALTTSMGSSTFPDDLAEYVPDIAPGITASIQMLPKQVFSSPADAQTNSAMYRSRVETIAMKVGRGMLALRMTSQAAFI